MDDLTAASYEDVVEFHRTFYGPNNASLSIAGDIDIDETRRLVEKWFGEIPAGNPVAPLEAPPAWLAEEKRVTLEDRVQLPRAYACWLTPAHYRPGDAEMDVVANVLAGGKNSRLYKRLVYDLQIAQDVSAFQASSSLSSEFCVIATARAGHSLDELEGIVDEEIARLAAEGPTEREVQRAVNQFEASFLGSLERVGGFGGKADRLNAYEFAVGNPDYFQEDLARYRALDPSDVRAAARKWLVLDRRVVLRIVPQEDEEISRGSTREEVAR